MIDASKRIIKQVEREREIEKEYSEFESVYRYSRKELSHPQRGNTREGHERETYFCRTPPAVSPHARQVEGQIGQVQALRKQ